MVGYDGRLCLPVGLYAALGWQAIASEAELLRAIVSESPEEPINAATSSARPAAQLPQPKKRNGAQGGLSEPSEARAAQVERERRRVLGAVVAGIARPLASRVRQVLTAQVRTKCTFRFGSVDPSVF